MNYRSFFALSMGVLTLGGSLFAQQPVRNDEPEGDDPKARQEYLERFQSGGDTSQLPPGARLRALQEMDLMIREEGERYRQLLGESTAGRDASLAGILPTSSQWLFIGPRPSSPGTSASSGRTTAVVVDPLDATGNTVYIGGAQGGIWKTTDGGTNWTPLTDAQASLATGAMAIDGTTNPATVYVGTGEQSFSSDSYYGVGILKSTDGGTVWTQLGASSFSGAVGGCSGNGSACGGAFIGGLSIRPGTPSTLIAAVRLLFSKDGVYQSIDSGVTWNRVSIGTTAIATAVQYATSNIAYAGMSGAGVWKSIDGGATWNAANGTAANVILLTDSGRVEIAVVPTDATGNTLFASVNIASTGNLSGFYKTTDGGTNWTKLGPNFDATTNPTGLRDYCSPQCWYDNVIAVNPTNGNIVFVGGSAVTGSISKSIDGGVTWASATSIHPDHHAAAFTADGSKLYWGNDGGVFKTTDTTVANPIATFTNLNTNLGLTQFYTYIALHPTNIDIAFGGAQDNGTQKYDGTQALGSAWTRVTCGDGGSAVIDAFNPSLVYSSCQRIQIIKSPTGGASGTFLASQTGVTPDDRVDFIPPMIGDGNPLAQNNLYFGTFRLYQSADAGFSWAAVSNDVTGGASTISNMAVAPSDRGVIYVGTNDGKVARGTGLTTVNCASLLNCFSDVTGTGLATRRVSAIAVSSTDPNRVYVTFNGYSSGDTQGNSRHVFRSAVGGTTWTNISSNLPNISVNDIVFDPDLANTLYVGTDIGVFRSQDDGVSWSTLANGLPRVAVFGLKLHRPSRTLRAATHGRGFWDLSVPALDPLTLTESTINFSAVIGRVSPSQVVTFANSSGASVTVSSVTVSGDYTRTHNCGVVANNGSCTVNVSFAPAASGPRNGTLTVNHNGAGGTRTSTLNGTGVNFTIGLSRPTRPSRTNGASIVIEQGQKGSIDLELGASGLASDVVELECIGSPRNSTCTVSPAHVRLDQATSPIQVTVSTTAQRSARLSRTSGTPAGNFRMQVLARVGTAVRTFDLDVTVLSARKQ